MEANRGREGSRLLDGCGIMMRSCRGPGSVRWYHYGEGVEQVTFSTCGEVKAKDETEDSRIDGTTPKGVRCFGARNIEQ